MSVLEAMATGLPVAAVDVGDVKRMLAPANRHLIVPKSDEPGFAAALAGLIAAPDRRAELGRLNPPTSGKLFLRRDGRSL